MQPGRPRFDPDEKCERFNISLPPSLVERLDEALAKGHAMESNRSEFLRSRIEEFLASVEPSFNDMMLAKAEAEVAKQRAIKDAHAEKMCKMSNILTSYFAEWKSLKRGGDGTRQPDMEWIRGRMKMGQYRKEFPGLSAEEVYDRLQAGVALMNEQKRRM